MKQPRGRPQATTQDVMLLMHVRNRDPDTTVDQAIEHGYRTGLLRPRRVRSDEEPEDPLGALKKRYERLNPIYPDNVFEYWDRRLGMPIKVRSRPLMGAALLTMKRTKTIK